MVSFLLLFLLTTFLRISAAPIKAADSSLASLVERLPVYQRRDSDTPSEAETKIKHNDNIAATRSKFHEDGRGMYAKVVGISFDGRMVSTGRGMYAKTTHNTAKVPKVDSARETYTTVKQTGNNTENETVVPAITNTSGRGIYAGFENPEADGGIHANVEAGQEEDQDYRLAPRNPGRGMYAGTPQTDNIAGAAGHRETSRKVPKKKAE